MVAAHLKMHFLHKFWPVNSPSQSSGFGYIITFHRDGSIKA